MKTTKKKSLLISDKPLAVSTLIAIVGFGVTAYLTYFTVTETFNKTIELNEIQEMKKIENSANLILLELNRIDDLSKRKLNDSSTIIELLEKGKYEGVPGFDLSGQFTTLPDDVWSENFGNILTILTPEEYFFIQNYYTTFRKLDSNYPIDTMSVKVEDNINTLLFWWKAFVNISIAYEPSQTLKENILNKLDNINK